MSPANQPAKPRRVVPVVAAPTRIGNIDVVLNALGTVTPRSVVGVKSRVDGQLLRTAFQEGQMVNAGDLLAEIDPRPFQVALRQAMGQLAKDQAQLANAQVDVERYRRLLAQDSISKQQVDTQEALVRQYQGMAQADQAAVDSARLQLSYSRVTAPVAGRVGLRQIDPGNIVHASDASGIVVVTQMQPITVLFTLPEDKVSDVMRRLGSGETIPVEAWDRSQRTRLASGRLVTVDNQIDTSTGTVKLRAEFANDDLKLFPNQFVNVRMQLESVGDQTLVPSAAIQRGAPGAYVYVVGSDHSVAVRPVTLGPARGEVTAIASGLAAGDLVVVDGSDKLRNGMKVDLVARDDTGSSPRKHDRRDKHGERIRGKAVPQTGQTSAGGGG